MNETLDEVCGFLRNWFTVPGGVHVGTYTVVDGALALPFLQNGQYYRIIGSVFNDGVHRYGDEEDRLAPESFHGAVWALAVPPAVISITKEIEEWNAQNAVTVASPYQSESFGGYSYSKAAPSGSGVQKTLTWRNVFAAKLARWRKL